MRTSTSLWAHLDAVEDEFINPSFDSSKEEVIILGFLLIILPYLPFINI